MLYLFGQILFCLLAAVAGGCLLGWLVRGYHEREITEDLRHTLKATEDVKDRELEEALRNAEAHNARAEALERQLEEARDQLEALEGVPPATTLISMPQPGDESAAASTIAVDETVMVGSLMATGSDPMQDTLADVREEARERATEALRLQSELGSLRGQLEEKAETIATLETRLVELEPLQVKLAEREQRLRDLQAAPRAAEIPDDVAQRLARSGEEIDALREQVHARDTENNRTRYELQEAQSALEAGHVRVQELEALTATLREGIENATLRNEKQENVHRSVVSTLRTEVSTLEARLVEPAAEVAEAATLERHWKELILERNREIAALKQELASAAAASVAVSEPEPEPAGSAPMAAKGSAPRERKAETAAKPARPRGSRSRSSRRRVAEPDDLQEIHGVGPVLEAALNEIGVTRFEHVARWKRDDVDRISQQVDRAASRIRRERWVMSARRLHRAKYGVAVDLNAD